MSIILPFEIDPISRAYHNIAFPLGIIQANLIDFNVWLSNKLVDCVYHEYDNFLSSVEPDIWSEGDKLTESQHILISPKAFNYMDIDFIPFIKSMLQNDNYFTGNYNEYYIPGKDKYHTRNNIHDYVIFGFDDDKKVFKSAGYLTENLYTFFDIPYESLINLPSSQLWIDFFKINKDFKPQININKIKMLLTNYVNSTCSTSVPLLDSFYGISAMDKFADFVQESDEVDFRYSRVFFEHRKIMLNRFITLAGNNFISSSYIKIYEEIYKNSQLVHILYMKYDITKRNKDLNKIYSLIKETNCKEHSLITKMLKYF